MSTLQVVTVTVTEAQAKAIRMLARSSTKDAATLANDLFAQVVRGRFKAKKEYATVDFGGKWDGAAELLGADKMPLPRKEYIERAITELYDILKEL